MIDHQEYYWEISDEHHTYSRAPRFRFSKPPLSLCSSDEYQNLKEFVSVSCLVKSTEMWKS